MLVLLLILAGLIVVGGVLLVVMPQQVRRFVVRFWVNLLGEKWARRMPMIDTPMIGGIGMIVVGAVIIVILMTQGANAIQ